MLAVVSLSAGVLPLLALADSCGAQGSVGLSFMGGARLLPLLPLDFGALGLLAASFCLLGAEPATDQKSAVNGLSACIFPRVDSYDGKWKYPGFVQKKPQRLGEESSTAQHSKRPNNRQYYRTYFVRHTLNVHTAAHGAIHSRTVPQLQS